MCAREYLEQREDFISISKSITSKIKDISNVIIVKNLSIYPDIWWLTSREYMNHKKIPNVIIVENLLLHQIILRNTSVQYIKHKGITNVVLVLVENPSLVQVI